MAGDDGRHAEPGLQSFTPDEGIVLSQIAVQAAGDSGRIAWRTADGLESLATPLQLETLSDVIDRILTGQTVGRGLVDLNA